MYTSHSSSVLLINTQFHALIKNICKHLLDTVFTRLPTVGTYLRRLCKNENLACL